MPPPQELLSVQVNSLPVEAAIRRITKNFSTFFVYGPERNNSGKPKLCKVVILSKNYTSNGGHDPTVIRTHRHRQVNSKVQSFESIIEDIQNQDETTREMAIERLAASQDERVVGILSELVINDSDEDVRAAAAGVLGEIRDETSVNVLIAAMQDDDVWVRENVVEALGKIGGVGVIETLRVALSDEDEDVRQAATDALNILED